MSTLNRSQSISYSWSDHCRMIWALASKDIVDALKNKTTLSTIIISVFMVMFYRYFPLVEVDQSILNVMLYAESESALVAALERSPSLAMYTFDSKEGMLNELRDGEVPELGLVIGETAVSQYQANIPIKVEGHVLYWVDDEQRTNLKSLAEAELSTLLDRPVTVELSGNDVFLPAEGGYFTFSPGMALIFVTLMVGIALIPNLMMEEKQAKTLDLLRVSPASTWHLVVGKALSGMFYGLAGSIVVLFVFQHLVLQWGLAILAAVIGTLFMAAIGLLLGSYVEVRAQLQMVVWILVIPLILPVILIALEGLVPSGIVALMRWVPTVAVAKLFRLSFSPDVAFTHYAADLSVALLITIVLFWLMSIVVNRQDRA
ncbi:MAG: ABC transporter permease [Chloroflexi bacterium]|nr:ABC transporter permease [Chloroflexota bacterium]